MSFGLRGNLSVCRMIAKSFIQPLMLSLSTMHRLGARVDILRQGRDERKDGCRLDFAIVLAQYGWPLT